MDKYINYIIITPVRDEEKYIQKTIQSVIKQTMLPKEWIFINDNSVDNTENIIKRYIEKFKFIKIYNYPSKIARIPGAGVMRAFNYGYTKIEDSDYDFIVKLDADLLFESDFFENIFKEFKKNRTLGIASGYFVEKNTGKPSKKYHPEITFGCTKIYKKECFMKIYPIEEIKGWDYLDNMKAKFFDYDTKIIKNQKVIHLKPLDSIVGYKKENYLKGYYDAYLRYLVLFVIIKSIKKMILEKPFFLNGLCYACGYLRNVIVDRKKYNNIDVVKLIHSQQLERIKALFSF